METFRQTWFFAGPQGASWEEVYEVEALTQDLAEPPPRGLLLRCRMACAHATVSLSKIHTRSLDNRENPPSEYAVNLDGTANGGDGDPAPTDVTAVILLACRDVTSGQSAHRFLWMRGLESEAVTRLPVSGRPVLSTDFRDNLTRFLFTLGNDPDLKRGYGMTPRVRSSWGGLLPRHEITGILGGPNSDSTALSFAADPGIDAGEIIQINATSKKVLPGLSGQFQVVSHIGVSIGIRYRCAQTNPPHSGYVYKVSRPNFLQVSPDRSNFSFLGSRQTKKPVTGQRGRRSAVRLRR